MADEIEDKGPLIIEVMHADPDPDRPSKTCRGCGGHLDEFTRMTFEEMFDSPIRSEMDRLKRWTVRGPWGPDGASNTSICPNCWQHENALVHAIDWCWIRAENVSKWFRYRFIRALVAPYWFIRYRVFNRYHVVATGDSPGYSDIAERMLGCCFTLLVQFVEKEDAFGGHVYWGEPSEDEDVGFIRQTNPIDYGREVPDPDQELRDRKAELMELYDWWKNKRGHEGLKYIEEGRRDQEQFMKLVRHRPYLWT